VPKVFSAQTLGKFEDASASVPLRPLDRAFEGAGIRLGVDPGGDAGSRKTQFRRYVASIDQRVPQQLERLGAALGAMIDDVATSKQEFLIQAAASDGFDFANGVFRPAATSPTSFAVTNLADLASIDERGKRLRILANETPVDAIGGATELAESVCRTVSRLIGKPVPAKSSGLAATAKWTLSALEPTPAGSDDAKKSAAVASMCLLQLAAVVTELDEARGSGRGRDGKRKGSSPRHARLAIGAAVTFAVFIAETYAERAPLQDD
jgi:hypothetical protein